MNRDNYQTSNHDVAKTDDLNELYQQVIIDHNKSPRNFRKLQDANRSAVGHNPLCGDCVTVFMKVQDDTIQDISFQGSGCAISKAAASVMTSNLKGKTKIEAKKLFDEYRRMITTGAVSQTTADRLLAFAGVHKFPARVKCAILPWHTAIAAFEEASAPVSTEAKPHEHK